MAKMILSMDGLVLKEIPLNQERLSIGRKPQNDIQIDNLAISGEHAVVVTILADSFLEDLNSTNGTLVNGQPIKKHFLRNSDVIELGKYKLKYMADLQAGAAASDFEKNAAIRSGSVRMPTELQLAPTENLSRSSIGMASQPKPPMPGAAAAIQLLQRRQGAGLDQNADDIGQARLAGGCHRQATAWLFHHACRGASVSDC